MAAIFAPRRGIVNRAVEYRGRAAGLRHSRKQTGFRRNIMLLRENLAAS
jgi:hypothetical protein